MDLTIRPVSGEQELQAYVAVMQQSLTFPPLSEFNWAERAGHENIRVALHGNEVVGGLVLLPFGQWFGGRSVPMIGISAVGVAPHCRAGGIGFRMMRHALEETMARGIPLSALYPATQPIYRRCGYEPAGVKLTYRLPTAAIDVRDRRLSVRPATPDDYPGMERLYTARARRTSGNLDRSPWNWLRARQFRGKPAYGYVFERDGEIEGYVYFMHKNDPVLFYLYDLEVLDLVVSTEAAARRLLTFFADHRSVSPNVVWVGAPVDPLLHIISEQRFEPVRRFNWMLRVVDVKAALETRGYPPGLNSRIALNVHDDVLPENNTAYSLEVADGRGRVASAGTSQSADAIDLDVRALAAVYTSYATPAELMPTGQVRGSEEALSKAAAIFAGPAPWMPDAF